MIELQQLFDAKWYLAQYADVATAGIDPFQHYLAHGRFEGRQPCALLALQLESALWQASDSAPYLRQLHNMVNEAKPGHAALAAWVLARWYGSFADWQQVVELTSLWLYDELALDIIGHQGPFLLAFSAYSSMGDEVKAAALLAEPRWPDTPDKQLAQAMVLAGQAKLSAINAIFIKHALLPLALDTAAELDALYCVKPRFNWRRWLPFSTKPLGAMPLGTIPLVTVIVPCFNAEKTLATALNSLLAQTHRNLQILVADDGSTDGSVALIKQFAVKDRRVKLVPLSQNSGAYVARNTALKLAAGAYITTHDADDWSHPEKIARQVQALQQNTAAMASVSHWVRCSADLQFQRWRMEEGWVYRNVSSLLFRRKVFTTLGYWDCVSVNADTEYYYRIKQQFGQHSIIEILPGVPLAFGRADDSSLSQTKASHLRTQFRGLRKDYHDAAIAWQQQAGSLYLDAAPVKRPFAVPAAMCRGTPVQQQHNLQLLLLKSGLFAVDWYLTRYPDVAACGMDPLQHFVTHGAAEGRDPSPLFSSSGYGYQLGLALDDPALLVAITANNTTEPLLLAGGQAVDEQAVDEERASTAPHVLLFAHAADHGQFGAERSFIDVLQSLQGTGYRLTVALPSALNVEYVTTLRQYCQQLLILPYAWWAGRRPCQQAQLAYLTDFIARQQVKLVYVNTLVLYEPILAARAAAVPTVVHVRELPQYDSGLCRALNATAEQVRQHVLECADYLVANSAVVANWLAEPQRCTVIANAMQLAPVPEIVAGKHLKVAMLSSNLAKKGLADFMALAQSGAQQQLPLDFYLFGPDSADLQHYIQQGEVPDNMKICGYVALPEHALTQVDVVLNLSHFQESFGRTVLEAMQAGRVVVAYDWGALPELIQPGCGFLVPFKDITAVEQVLCRLQQDKTLLQSTARQAKRYATERYSLARLGQDLRTLFSRIMA